MSTLDFTREQLAQYILNTAKESSISKIKAIILNEKVEDETNDPFDMLPKQVQDMINKGLEDIEQGRVKSHEEATVLIKKRYNITG